MRRLAGLLFVAAVVIAALWLWHAQRTGIRPANPNPTASIVLITVDTLRADRLRRGFTPSIDALGGRGLRFDNARTAVPLTLPSHVTIMTGTRPAIHGVHVNGVAYKPGPPTLARVLHDNGYSTGAFVGAYVLNHVFGLNDGFDLYDDRVHRDPARGTQLEAERRGGEVVDAALAWLRTAHPPFFLWVHLYDPHAPYDPPAEFLARAGGRAYDGEVAYADAQVGRILEAVSGRAIVALAGDHGEGLGEHGEETHGMLAYDSTLRVPLVLVEPVAGRRGIVESTVSLEDLAGALLRAAGVPSRMPLRDGATSIADSVPVRAETEYPRVAGWHPLAVLVDERWKLILSAAPELYDIWTDYGERHNLAGSKTSLVDAMSRRLRELATPATTPTSAPLAPEAAERLRALGYVSGSAPARRDSANTENPADVIGSWTRFERALGDVVAGQVGRALPALRELAERFPLAPVFQATYARALSETGNPKAALAVYREAVERWPADASLYHDMAIAARAGGDIKEALRAEQGAIALDRNNPAALNGLGLLQAESGDAAGAAASFERAALEDPSNASYWVNLGNARRELADLDRAEAAYRRALDIDVQYADAANGLGVVLVQRHRAAEAIPLFERALARAPAFHEARLNLGIACHESGQLDRALAAYRQVIAGAPRNSREWTAATTLLAAAARR